MLRRISIVAIFIICTLPSKAQNLPIRLVERKQLKVVNHPRVLLLPTQCDESGKLYVRSFGSASLLRLTSEGEKDTEFAIPTTSDPQQQLHASAYLVLSNGEVFIAARNPTDTFILRFRRDGTVESKLRLEGYLVPGKFFVFPNGNILIFGEESAGENVPMRPTIDVYDSNGKLLSKSTKKGTDLPEDREEAIATGGSGAFLPSFDGNAIFVSGPDKPRVWLLDPLGNVLRSFSLPSPGPGFEFRESKWMEGRIVTQYFRTEKKDEAEKLTQALYVVTDSGNGDRVITYDIPLESGTALACATSNEFTLVSRQKSKLAFVSVPLR
jgi:hypothetical protein